MRNQTNIGAPKVSFVIPCLNEAESLGYVIDEINSSFAGGSVNYEIVVADNGSTDGSQEIATTRGARIVSADRRGYGAALIAGIAGSCGEYVVMGDADGSYRFGDAAPMIPLLDAGADVVMGNRFTGGILPGAMPVLHRYLGNPVLSWLGRLFFGVPVGDFHCGLRAFRKERIDELGLATPGMEFASELLVRSQKRSYRIEEVPVTLGPDLRSRRPHLRTWRDGWRHLRFLLMHSPKWTFLTPAVIAAVFAALITVLTTFGPVTVGSVEFSYRTSIIASAIATIATVAGWSAYIARAVVDVEAGSRRRIGTEPLALMSLGVALVGAIVVVAQFLSWQGTGFGPQPGGANLLASIAGGFLFSLGGTSLFLSLLAGLVRNSR